MGETKTLIGSVPTYMGTWQSDREYSIDNVVSSDGNAYISLIENNTAALTDTNAWAVFVQGLNGIMVEAAVGKQKVISKIAQQGVDISATATYDEMANAVEELFLPTDTDFWKAFGYDSAEDLEGGLSDLVRNTQYMQEQWERVLTGDLTVANWKNTYPLGADKMVICPKIDTSNLTSMNGVFNGCGSLLITPALDISKATDISNMFYLCTAMRIAPLLDTSKVTNMKGIFSYCKALRTISLLNTSKVTNIESAFYACESLTTCHLTNLKVSLSLQYSPLLSPESVAFIVSHAANTSAITITLHATAYANAIADEQVQAALEAHPLVTLASA